MPVPGKDKKKKVKMEKEKAAQIKSTQLLMRAIQLNYQQHWYVWLNNQYAVLMIYIVIMKNSSDLKQTKGSGLRPYATEPGDIDVIWQCFSLRVV